MRAAFHVRVTGRVQGVGFRDWTRRRAEGLGLKGWVRNEADGAVTALIEGDDARIAEMMASLHKGPAMARVDRVETTPAVPDDAQAGFFIRS
jgi:acylphosphatase